ASGTVIVWGCPVSIWMSGFEHSTAAPPDELPDSLPPEPELSAPPELSAGPPEPELSAGPPELSAGPPLLDDSPPSSSALVIVLGVPPSSPEPVAVGLVAVPVSSLPAPSSPQPATARLASPRPSPRNSLRA